MVVNGLYVHGRPNDKVRNLRRFAEQWAEFKDEESLESSGDDTEFISGFFPENGTLDKYHEMANAMEE